jgi:PKD repeat protein
VPIEVLDPPGNRAPTVNAGAAPKSGTAPLSVLFTASGADPDGDALTYSWDFGDGATASGRKVTHVYAAGGTYTATVTARDPAGLTGTATVAVVVGNPPGNQAPTVQAAADPASGGAPLTVRFSASGRDPEGGPLMYVWDFGDGGKAGGKAATHTYAQAGTYTAKVTVTDAKGATGSATVQVVVEAAQRGVRGAQAEVALPRSVRAFTRRGLRVTMTCAATGRGRAALTATRTAARRLGLARRTVAARQLRCHAGRERSVRLKPSRATARRLAAARSLRLTLRLSVKGTRAVSRRVTIRGARAVSGRVTTRASRAVSGRATGR